MTFQSLPKKQGLYDPQYEHDACGIGFVVNIKGKKSHALVRQGVEILINLTHRGGCGSEHNTGDGAGILIQLPHKFFAKVCKNSNINLPSEGNYGVGMLFLPQDLNDRKEIEAKIEEIINHEGQKLLGWRDVPHDDSMIGKTAKRVMPYFKQVFIEKSNDIKDEKTFERKLYAIRKSAEKYSLDSGKHFYAASFSSKTIVYKGMLTASQVDEFYLDLKDEDFQTALTLVHSRYSTNTFPSWERAHPNRYVIHNGEINTLRGNVNWMKARESIIKTDIFGTDVKNIFPIINPEGSDSAMFDNCLEFLSLSGRSIEHSAMMMIPEPWSKHESMDEKRKAFYEYHSCIMEPWDGPASIAFTDGTKVGAVLDRNGLRPSRYYVTTDDTVIMASEVGVLNIDPSKVLYKERLHPGKTLLIDTKLGKIIEDNEIKEKLSNEHPYKEWIQENMLTMEGLKAAPYITEPDHDTVFKRQKAFGYTYEELKKVITPMAQDGIDPIGAMGYDSPLAVLSEKPQLLYNYFKQLFAQVTNPPIDAIREELITASETYIGSEGNLIKPTSDDCKQIKISRPVINNEELARFIHLNEKGFKTVVIPMLFKAADKGMGLKNSLDDLFSKADQAIEEGSNILILSDRGTDKENAAIPALLATSGLHHHLIRQGSRTKVSIMVETGEPREVHQFALLVGYGASAINPYLAFETIDDLIKTGKMSNTDHETAVSKYIKAATKGVIKVLSKMGISTIQSYQGAQIFEAIGLNISLVDKYFTSTPSRIGGIGLDIVAEETLKRHEAAFDERFAFIKTLDSGGTTMYRSNDEYHLFNPESVYKLQLSCRNNDYNLYKEYSDMINNQTQKHCTLRGLMDFEYSENPINIDEVESVESICKRFKTGAMSYGSISKEAHESMAIAMNRLGGKSNTGEGGEDIDRFTPDNNGDSRCSAIKQVASGRFGVTSHYLVNSKEIQIKMAQGAKPGEGGQLPGKKVYPWVANTRGTTTGVGLISPPPHHDIYSIEDLAELVHDLKNANRTSRICVKLVSEVGVGTVAAGVAKGRADVVLISGYDGGTGASPRTSIKHAGLPWEIGVAETHQTLVLNNLRSRITVETDGKLLTGRDIVIASLLGAEEFGFATAPLVVLGCVMMRVCNLNTCPVGVATQNPELRKKFKGSPDHVVNFMKFIAQEIREYMAKLGFRTFDEMIGRADKLKKAYALDHWKAKGLDFSSIFYKPEIPKGVGTFCQMPQDHELDKSIDITKLLDICKPALDNKQKVKATLPIKNINRVVGTILGSEISKKYGGDGLPENTIELKFEGSAGQSYAAFVPKGVFMELEGDANDYFAKGLSGAKLTVYPPKTSTFTAENNIIIGNVAFYGATSGEAYIRGIAGERFCVRNSGADVVVEGVGDHACEYMTGGTSIILGKTGRNFAAGMSGGIAYIYDEAGSFSDNCNMEMVNIKELTDNEEIKFLKSKIENHFKYTESDVAKKILNTWEDKLHKFVKVLPKDYERMINKIKEAENQGLSGDRALMAAFIANNNDMSRLGGN